DAGAPAGDVTRETTGERGDEGGGRRGVRDAHVAGQQATVPGGDQVAGRLDADLNGGDRLVPGHRGLDGDVPGARTHLAGEQRRSRRQRRRDADVDDGHLGAGLGGDGVDDGAARDEVRD